MAAPALNEESVEKRLMSVTNTQDSIQSLSLWILHHKAHCARIVQLWYKAVKKSVKPSHRLTLFYLCNDVVQTCKRKKATVFAEAFKPFIRKATPLVRDASVKAKVERIFNIWEERLVFTQDYIMELKQGLEAKETDDGVFKKPIQRKLKSKEKPKEIEVEKEELFSPSLEEFDAVQPADASLEPQEKEESKSIEEDVDIPTEETLALFKPGEMVEKIRFFMLQASDVDIKVRNLSTLKLDASSIEAIKQLKDRAHGNEFSSQFEESCQRLEEAVKALDKKKGEQKELLDQLRISEYFYDQQYREARIVANAYKNYGARINTMKRKLEDLSKTLPEPPPPPPPPSETLSGYLNLQPMDMDLDMENGPPGLDEEDDRIPSPPDEAPSPVGSLADDDLMASESSTSLDNRLANFIPSIHSSMVPAPVPPPEDEMPIPVYVPSSGASMMRRPSTIKTLTESDMPFPEDEGGGTPLTDEQPSTPVQDEEPAISPPPPPPPPPKEKKENPIDFLSRLIAQTQKNKPSGPPSSSSSFLESFSMLTSKVKEHIDSKKMVPEDSSLGDNQAPKSWAAWKAEKAAEVGGMEPPTMLIPPPPMPNFGPLPLPGGLTVSMPPPMPPPVLPPVISMSIPPPVMTSPPAPFYQHTSPGQKENWPDAERMGMVDSGDAVTSPNIIYPPVQDVPSAAYPPLNTKPGKSILRKSSQSVLKELTRSSEEDSGSLAAMVPPPPPPIDSMGEGSAITTLGAGGSSGEALEFKEKLKRKTSSGGTTPPAYTPNPIRPNLMTLTPSGEADMDMDVEAEEEGADDEEPPRIPVLSSVVRRVDPHEQKLARDKEMHHLRGRDLEMDKPPFLHKERHYGQESSMDEYYPVSSAPSSYNYVDDRSFPAYGAERPPDPYFHSYPASSQNFYRPQMPYNDFPYSGPPQHKRPFIRRGGNFRGGNRRNFNHF